VGCCAGEVVVRTEIRDRLWPNNTVVEFDHGINTAVRRLRDVLGKSAEKFAGPARILHGHVDVAVASAARNGTRKNERKQLSKPATQCRSILRPRPPRFLERPI
jgi:hypothetical protein